MQLSKTRHSGAAGALASIISLARLFTSIELGVRVEQSGLTRQAHISLLIRMGYSGEDTSRLIILDPRWWRDNRRLVPIINRQVGDLDYCLL